MSEPLDLRTLAPNNRRREPRILLVEHASADSEARWSRALELLLEAGTRADHDHDED